ncbi:MAG: GNAT family N-acetyltransferase, partial [Thermoactinomyces sp.]
AESLKKQGFTSLMVQVLKENPARLFYEKLGATPIASKMVSIGNQELEEISYQWSSIDSLLKKALFYEKG